MANKTKQGNIILELRSLVWKQQTEFAKYRRVINLLEKTEQQGKNHEQHLEEIVVRRDLGN